jgi:hypothetical protein
MGCWRMVNGFITLVLFQMIFDDDFLMGFFVEVDFYQVLIIQLIQLFRESFDA